MRKPVRLRGWLRASAPSFELPAKHLVLSVTHLRKGMRADDDGARADPLRVLRAVRFASRYAFTMVEQAQQAARSGEVRCRAHAYWRVLPFDGASTPLRVIVAWSAMHPVKS